MLVLADFPEIARKAIRTNVAMRNSRVFFNEAQQARIRATRRRQIREWIDALRVVSNPAMAKSVEQRLRSTGPLMAHDLRNRIILAGLDYLIAKAKSGRTET